MGQICLDKQKTVCRSYALAADAAAADDGMPFRATRSIEQSHAVKISCDSRPQASYIGRQPAQGEAAMHSSRSMIAAALAAGLVTTGFAGRVVRDASGAGAGIPGGGTGNGLL